MMDFWTSRVPRERLLIVLAAGLVAVLLLNLFMVRPLKAARDEASASLSVAARTLDAVSAAQPMERAGAANLASSSTGEALRAQLVDLATQRGLAVSRLQTSENGTIIIQFDNASAPLIFAWLESAERQYGAMPKQASIFAEASGTVRASFEFRGGAS
ncbi:MAG: type II secretion system protein GspM [Hyphomonas sp.]